MEHNSALGKKQSNMAKLALGFLVSGVIIFFLIRQISIHNVLHILLDIEKPLILLALLPYFLEYYPPALRLRMLTRGVGSGSSLFTAYKINLVSAFGNYVLPFRSGEILKIFAIADNGTKADIPKSTATGLVIIERLLDLFIVIIAFFLALLINGGLSLPRGYIIVCAGFLLGILLIFYLLVQRRIFVESVIRRLPDSGKWKRIKAGLLRLVEAFCHLRNPVVRLQLIGTTVLYWSAVWISYWLAFFCIRHPIGLAESFLIMTVGTLGITIPSGPGSVGVLQGAFVVGGALLGISSEICLAAGIFYQVVQAIFIVLIGGTTALGYGHRLFGRKQ